MSETEKFDLIAHLHHQREWSAETFGPGSRVEGIIAHMEKELEEVRRAPFDLYEVKPMTDREFTQAVVITVLALAFIGAGFFFALSGR